MRHSNGEMIWLLNETSYKKKENMGVFRISPGRKVTVKAYSTLNNNQMQSIKLDTDFNKLTLKKTLNN